ncbi:MAG: amino acid permease [Ignavibacteriales bacterium]|nr:amino acid permease [Ignavibacteriales bacterium]
MATAQPQRQLGFWKSTAIIIGAVIGAGVFMNIPLVAKQAGSPAIMVLIWLIGGLVWIPQIAILAEMGTAYPNQGGPYYFIYKAGSPFLAFMYTWTAFLTSDTPTITIIALMAATAASFLSPLLHEPFYAKLFAASLILLFAAIQVRNVKTGGTVQIVLTLSKVLPLVIIIILGLFFLRSGNFYIQPVKTDVTDLNIFSALTTGVSTTIWAYAGFLNILYMAGEVKEPGKTLPRSLILSLGFVIIAYVCISLAVSFIIPFSEILKIPSGEYVNPFLYIPWLKNSAGTIFSIMFFISMLGVLNSVIMTQPRLEYAMANDGLFFKQFGSLHEKYLTPVFSIWVQAAIAIALFLLQNVEAMLGYFTLSYVLQNALVYIAIFKLRSRPDYHPLYKLRFWKFPAGISVVIQISLAYGAIIAYPVSGILACTVLIFTGLPTYLYFKNTNSR